MVDACLAAAHTKDHVTVWKDREPEDFTIDLEQLQIDYATLMTKCTLAESVTGGATDTKAVTETTLENQTFLLARALASHFKKTKDLARRAQVDLSRPAVMRLRENELIARATAVRDLGATTQFEPDAGKRGVGAQRVAMLTLAIDAFKKAMSAPLGEIVNRSTVLREIETDTAALMEQLGDLDDLVVQFEDYDGGDRFIEAWKRARTISDRVAEQGPRATAKKASVEAGTN